MSPAIGAVVLAAGRSSRMGSNKLMIEIAGKPLVAHAVDAALEAGLAPVVVVTGHEASRVQAGLAGRTVIWAHNALYAEGMASSLQVGIRALPRETQAALICLGDMPSVTARHMADIVSAYDPSRGRNICVPVHQGQRGNPVLFGCQFFPEFNGLAGDRGARQLLAIHADQLFEVTMSDDGILADLDTAEALATFCNQQS